MKKIIYAILILIILVGTVVIATTGLNVDIIYSKNARIAVYLGKTFDNEDLKQIVNEVFGQGRTIVQKIEYFEDMALITIKQQDGIEDKSETLNIKINEKYELENKAEDIQVTYQPKTRLSSIVEPYIIPFIIIISVIIIYAVIRFRKLGIVKIFINYVFTILVSEAVYLSIIAISRIPVNRLTIPIGLVIFVVAITITTLLKEQELKGNEIKEKN